MKSLTLVLAVLFFSVSLKAQTAADIITDPTLKVVNIGADYSGFKCVGYDGFFDPEAIANDFPKSWNHLLRAEADKYSVKDAFRLSNISYDFDIMNEVNSNINYKTLIHETFPDRFTEADIQARVKSYGEIDSDREVAFVWIVEAISKENEIAIIHFAFFNTKTREVLLTKRMEGKPGGFGFRNFWARPYDEILSKIQKKEYKTWAKEFGASGK